MTSSSGPEIPIAWWRRACGLLLWLALPPAALGWSMWPASSTWGGLAWLALCLAGIATLGQPATPSTRPDAHSPSPVRAARRWWLACLGALALAGVATLGWHDRMSSLQDNARLMLAAGACLLLVKHLRPNARLYQGLLHTAALAAVVAILVALTHGRDQLPSNAIPWAVSVSFIVCLLVPAMLDRQATPSHRLAWAACALMALAAVLASQTRGAMAVALWAAWLLLRNDHTATGKPLGRHLVVLAAVIVALASTAWWDGDPLRLRAASQDVVQALIEDNPNTAVGSRLYMWRVALEGIAQSPWWGHGMAQREAAMAALAAQHDPMIWAGLRHFHNEYLNAWYDHGLAGLAGVLLTLAGIVAAALALPPTHTMARRQLLGLALMHGLAGLSNVNTAHNLYTLTLGLAVAVALLGAASQPNGPSGPASGRD